MFVLVLLTLLARLMGAAKAELTKVESNTALEAVNVKERMNILLVNKTVNLGFTD